MALNYRTIKWVLKQHIKNGVRSLWTWTDNEFRCIFENYSGDDRIYTPEQLLRKLDNDNN